MSQNAVSQSIANGTAAPNGANSNNVPTTATNNSRMVNRNGQWWYWTPDNNWMQYNRATRQWTPYQGSPAQQGQSGVPAR